MKKNYVGELDLLKFLMCLVICLMHVDQRFGSGKTFFTLGGFAVEVFFAISGYFMCFSAEKAGRKNDHTVSLAGETFSFVFGKIRRLIFPYLITFTTNLVIWYLKKGQYLRLEHKKKFFDQLFVYLPNFLLLSMGGTLADDILVNISWYLSAMLIAMFFLYPLLRKFGQNFRLFAAPAIVVFGTGILYQFSDSYKGIEDYVLCLPHGLWRAFIGLSLGCLIYEAADCLRSLQFTKAGKLLLSLFEVGNLLAIIYIFRYAGKHAGFTFLIFDFFLLTIAASKQGIWAEFLCNPLSRKLGTASMYVYLLHVPVLNILRYNAPDMKLSTAVMITLPCVALLVAVVWKLSDLAAERHWVNRFMKLFVK